MFVVTNMSTLKTMYFAGSKCIRKFMTFHLSVLRDSVIKKQKSEEKFYVWIGDCGVMQSKVKVRLDGVMSVLAVILVDNI